MTQFMESIVRLGGIASTDALIRNGVPAEHIFEAVRRGDAIRVRGGWVAIPAAPADVVRAVRVGGQLSCVSVLKTEGLWCATDRRLHVRVAPGARNLASPTDRRIPLGRPERFGVALHRSHRAPFLDEPEGPVDSFAWALLHSITCQSKVDAIVTLDSALHQNRISRSKLEFLAAGLPMKYRAYLDLTDGSAASGLETKARLGLRHYNIPYETQVKIAGVGSIDLLVGERLVVETDGREWHTKTEAYLEDRRRDLELAALGYAVLRLSYLQVMEQWDAVIAVIRAMVARDEHRWSPKHLKAGLGTGVELI